MTKLKHVAGICGSGKTEAVINKIGTDLLNPLNQRRIVIWASVTNNLTEGTATRFKVKFPSIRQRIIDSNQDDVNSVSAELIEVLNADNGSIYNATHQSQIIFTSHKALALIPTHLVSKCILIIDELPTLIAEYQRVPLVNSTDTLAKVQPYLSYKPSEHAGYQCVHLVPEGQQDAVSRAENLLNEDAQMYFKPAQMLKYLANGGEMVYHSTKNKSEYTWHNYEYFTGLSIINNIRSAAETWLLSASLEGLFTEKLLAIHNIQIECVTELNGYLLPVKHPNTQRVTIIPFIKNNPEHKGGSFSGSFADEHMKNVVENNCSNKRVHEEFAIWVSNTFAGSEYIYAANKTREKPIALNHGKAVKVQVMAHGQNDYSQITKAAFLANLRPSPDESNAIKRLAIDNNLDPKELEKSYITQQCHEACYQFSCRIAFRNLSRNNGVIASEQEQKPCIIIVPDMAHALYLQSKMDGATIDTSMSFTRKKVTVSADELTKRQVQKEANKAIKNAAKQAERFKILTTIELLNADGMSLKEACSINQIDPKTRRNWIKMYQQDWDDYQQYNLISCQ
ncbi:hypothetical protein AB4140_13830 [Shewanella sp. 10N.286.51.B2]|uniref:hypothetical protein n=1 Tax=Shewanella sp. 10N.286.51.B2 TaxID=3229707 RepID=UPI00355354FC